MAMTCECRLVGAVAGRWSVRQASPRESSGPASRLTSPVRGTSSLSRHLIKPADEVKVSDGAMALRGEVRRAIGNTMQGVDSHTKTLGWQSLRREMTEYSFFCHKRRLRKELR